MARSFEEAINFNRAVGARNKRADSLLRELYHEEINPRFRVPHMPGLKLLLFASAISIMVFVVVLLMRYNNFIDLREAVNAAEGNLQSAIQRRSNLFANMIKLTLSHAELEHSVYSYAARMRSQLTHGQVEGAAAQTEHATREDGASLIGAGTIATVLNEKGQPLSAQQLANEPDQADALSGQGGAVAALAGASDMQSSLSRLMAVAERYPDVRSSETYHKMMDALMNMEDLITTRRVEAHAAMQRYNGAIQGWPWTILANFTGFTRRDYFETFEGDAGAPVLTPAIARELVPVGSMSASEEK